MVKLRMTEDDIFLIRQAMQDMRKCEWNPTRKARFIKIKLHLPFSVSSIREVAIGETYAGGKVGRPAGGLQC